MKFLKMIFLPLIIIFIIVYIIFFFKESRKMIVKNRNFEKTIQQNMLNDFNNTNISLKKPMNSDKFISQWRKKFNQSLKNSEKSVDKFEEEFDKDFDEFDRNFDKERKDSERLINNFNKE